ncbi:Peptidase-M24 domain-containing protein [Mycena indigotica]|uniref:Peptidase-M24 domain-containing protein n=1 Tax=Mycena indigotica TaxID=2126181 RepID=A0A8H6S998_9AGAR|nr:Peptidase-M24 domain-containing protein [Mycena indigotica]KAF7295326.1 Peptidase-M24 domain-containing protein [Mycena indigotica]
MYPSKDAPPSPRYTLQRRSYMTTVPIVLFACMLWYSLGSFRHSFSAPKAIISHCGHLSSISLEEFQARQTTLARTLVDLKAAAYITEPGASAEYYANISNANWYLSERPLLLIITPEQSGDDIQAKISILTPAFEIDRAKLLPIASNAVNFYEWAEDANPYDHALSALPNSVGAVFVDGHMRTFIVDGLRKAHPDPVASAPYEIQRIRERKSPSEIELLKCANEATVLSIRAVREKLYFGIRESAASAMMREALAAAGLRSGGCLTLFGENAALPHGAGTDKTLGRNDFALFDCTANLHGYSSDVTRTVAISGSEIPADHLAIWYSVRDAQTSAIQTARAGVVAKEVDSAARKSLNNTKYFTHRLGHGIGLEVHEDPYLNGGSLTVLETGHSFSDEPGYYVVGKVGVRLEDCFYIHENGSAVFLTAGVGGQAESPWRP